MIESGLEGLSTDQLAAVAQRPAAVSYYLNKAADIAREEPVPARGGKFEVYKDKAGEFRFRLRSRDGSVLLKSEGYKDRSSVRNGIASVKRNAVVPARFELKQARNGKPYFVLKAGNHQIIGSSAQQASVRAADMRIIEAMSVAPTAALESKNDEDTLELGDRDIVRPRKASEAKAALDGLTSDVSSEDPYYKMLSTDEAAKALSVKQRQTILNWIKAAKLIGFKKAKRGVLVPAMQMRNGDIAPGVGDIIQLMGDPERAWHFLARPIVIEDERVRPIEKLFSGQVEKVLRVASAYGEHFA